MNQDLQVEELKSAVTTKNEKAKPRIFDRSVTPIFNQNKSFEFRMPTVIIDSPVILSEESPVERKVITEMRHHFKGSKHQKSRLKQSKFASVTEIPTNETLI